MIRIRTFGEDALLIEWPEQINSRISQHLHAVHQQLKTHPPNGYLYSVPAYCTLTVIFDNQQTSSAVLHHTLSTLLSEETYTMDTIHRQLRIPVCYTPDKGPDLEAFSATTGLTIEEIIHLHTQPVYRVYLMGFLPGFPYMGTLPEPLHCARKKVPRLKVPIGSVGLAGQQTGIYPKTAPGGWQLIGRTPIPLFVPERETPFLFEAGDAVQFYSIDEATYDELREKSDFPDFDLSPFIQ